MLAHFGVCGGGRDPWIVTRCTPGLAGGRRGRMRGALPSTGIIDKKLGTVFSTLEADPFQSLPVFFYFFTLVPRHHVYFFVTNMFNEQNLFMTDKVHRGFWDRRSRSPRLEMINMKFNICLAKVASLTGAKILKTCGYRYQRI